MPIRINGTDKESTINQVSAIQHGTYYLADNPNLYEVQRANTFEFVVVGLDNIQRAGALGVEDSGTIANAGEVLRLSVSSAFVPHFSQQPIEVRRGNSTVKFAGTPSFEGGSLRVIDYIGADSKSVLMAWQALSYNTTTEKIGLVSDYKKDAWLIEYTPDYQEVRRWRLHGCWVSNITEDEYSADSNEKHTLNVTIQYDRAEIDMSEAE